MTGKQYKVLVIGDSNVGKTSIIKRYAHGTFTKQYRATVGVDFALKILNVGEETVRLQLWDIAGQEQFGSMTRVYYKHVRTTMRCHAFAPLLSFFSLFSFFFNPFS